jgi:hypothetical protein
MLIVVFKRESGFVRGLRITEYNAITTRAKGRSVHGIEVIVHRVKGFPNTRIQRPNHAFSLRGMHLCINWMGSVELSHTNELFLHLIRIDTRQDMSKISR